MLLLIAQLSMYSVVTRRVLTWVNRISEVDINNLSPRFIFAKSFAGDKFFGVCCFVLLAVQSNVASQNIIDQ